MCTLIIVQSPYLGAKNVNSTITARQVKNTPTFFEKSILKFQLLRAIERIKKQC